VASVPQNVLLVKILKDSPNMRASECGEVLT
jgi:hypothetical protein